MITCFIQCKYKQCCCIYVLSVLDCAVQFVYFPVNLSIGVLRSKMPRFRALATMNSSKGLMNDEHVTATQTQLAQPSPHNTYENR